MLEREGYRDEAQGPIEEWECMQCGYFHEGKNPPRRCPECGAVDRFELVEYFDDDDWDDDDDYDYDYDDYE